MGHQIIAENYLRYLEQGATSKIIDLFAPDGYVDSPLYGMQKAADFYQALSADTISSTLKIRNIFEDHSTNSIALYFSYVWVLKNQEQVQFDVVDIIEFDRNNKIVMLKIIYDTVVSRKLMDAHQ